MIYAPVCTKKGATRSNKCVAECKGEKVAYDGPCKPKTPSVVEETSTKDNATATAASDANADTAAPAADGAEANATAVDAPGKTAAQVTSYWVVAAGELCVFWMVDAVWMLTRLFCAAAAVAASSFAAAAHRGLQQALL
jgi:hypothetical protein